MDAAATEVFCLSFTFKVAVKLFSESAVFVQFFQEKAFPSIFHISIFFEIIILTIFTSKFLTALPQKFTILLKGKILNILIG